MFSHKARIHLIVSTTLLAILCTAVTAVAYEIPIVEQRLTVNTAIQEVPDISGTKVVYADLRNTHIDVYLYDLTTRLEKRLTTNSANQMSPRVSGNKVVFLDNRNGHNDIYLYDLSTNTEKRLTTNAAQQDQPAISGNKVVYRDTRNGNYDIYLYDLSTNTEKRLTYDAHAQEYPAISGNRVVYQDFRHSNSEIYLYDLSTKTEKRLTNNALYQGIPDISGTHVIYHDARNTNYDIYHYDLRSNTERRLSTNPAYQYAARISGNKVVYRDARNGSSDLFLFDMGTFRETQLVAEGSNQVSPAIDGARVVWADYRNVSADIYLGELALPRFSVSAPSVVSYNTSAKLSGTLTSFSGIPIANEYNITLDASSDGVIWTQVRSVATNPSGAFATTSPSLTTSRHLRLTFHGDTTYPSSYSATLLVKPKVYLSRPSFGKTTLTYGKTYKARGYLKPRHTEGTYPVKIAAYKKSSSTGKWVYKKTYSAKAFDYSSYTKYVKSIKLPSRGKWRLRAVHAEDSLNAKTYSSWRYVTVK